MDRTEHGKRRRFGSPAEPIGDIIKRLFRGGRLSRESGQLAKLRQCWPEVVGQDMTGELTPFRVRDGTVWIRASTPTLYFEMCNFGSQAVLDRMEELMPGTFREVRFCQ